MIREFTSRDTDAIVSIWRQASAVAHPFLPADFIEQEADRLRSIYLLHAETWVCDEGGTVAGFIALAGDEVAGLFLDPDLHRRGFGRALVDFAADRKGPLTVEVFQKNTLARSFYAACGFSGNDVYVHDPTGETVCKLAQPAG